MAEVQINVVITDDANNIRVERTHTAYTFVDDENDNRVTLNYGDMQLAINSPVNGYEAAINTQGGSR